MDIVTKRPAMGEPDAATLAAICGSRRRAALLEQPQALQSAPD
jgi:hypothetical protein